MMLKKQTRTKEFVIYNFDIKDQKLELLFRGEQIPRHLKEYRRLWRLKDPKRQVETVIISV